MIIQREITHFSKTPKTMRSYFLATPMKVTAILIIHILLIPVCSAVGSVPVFHVDAENKTGTEIGTALGSLIVAEFSDIEEKIDSYLKSFVSQDEFNYIIRRRLNAIRVNIDRKYRDEVRSMASLLVHSGKDRLGDGYLSLNEFWFFQLIPDIERQNSCSGFGVFKGCSASGTPIVGRNLEWTTTQALRSIQAITVYEYGKRVLVNIGFAGYLGVLSGFNDRGLFAAYMDSSMGMPYPDPPEGRHSAVFDIRKALETATSISDAGRILSRPLYPFGHNVLLADKRDVQVLEHPQGEAGKHRTTFSPLRIDISWDKPCQITVVNFFALKSSSNNVLETVKWRRFESLANYSRDNKAYIGDVMDIMFDTKKLPYSKRIFSEKTVQSMVFTPADRTLYLYTVPVSGIQSAHPVMEEVTVSERDDSEKNILAIFLLIIGVPAGLFMYYQWEIKLKKSLISDEEEYEEE